MLEVVEQRAQHVESKNCLRDLLLLPISEQYVGGECECECGCRCRWLLLLVPYGVDRLISVF